MATTGFHAKKNSSSMTAQQKQSAQATPYSTCQGTKPSTPNVPGAC